MIEYKNLLCPVDFSDSSKSALRVAIDFAERFQAKLHIIHVYQLPASTFPDGVYDAPDGLEKNLEEQLTIKLDEFIKANSGGSACAITTTICEGITHMEINQSADELKADMIVMGTHGRTGVSHVLLGSVAERVVRTSAVPVVTVKK